jgi:hypothetical protein
VTSLSTPRRRSTQFVVAKIPVASMAERRGVSQPAYISIQHWRQRVPPSYHILIYVLQPCKSMWNCIHLVDGVGTATSIGIVCVRWKGRD